VVQEGFEEKFLEAKGDILTKWARMKRWPEKKQ
jgi:hypothetical protein